MGLKDFFSWLFRKKSSVSSIALLSDIVPDFKRTDIQNGDSLHQLDSYKEFYLSLLSKNRTILSKHLETNLNQDTNMYTELLLKAMGVNSLRNLYEDKNKEQEEQELEKRVSIRKMHYYDMKLEMIEKEAILRIIALKELLEEKKFYLPNKKNAIYETINQLSSSFIMVQSQRRAIQVETDAYLKEYTEMSEEDLSFVTEKRNALLKLLVESVLPTGDRYTNKDLFRILSMEIELETYLYQKKEDMLRLKEEILLSDEENVVSDKNEHILTSMALYGIKLVTEEELALFYEKKFALWKKKCLEGKSKGIPQKPIEVYFYTKLLEKRLESLLKGNLGAYQEILKPDTVSQAVSRYLKNDDGKYAISEWDVDRLRFVLSFDEAGDLEKYFQSFLSNLVSIDSIKMASFDFDLHPMVIKMKQYVSLETIYWIARFDSKTRLNKRVGLYLSNHDSLNSNVSIMYPIYLELKKVEEQKNNTFSFPKGIKAICIDDLNTVDLSTDDKKFIQNIRQCASGKNVVFEDMEYVKGSMFDDLEFENIYFKNVTLVENAFQRIKAKGIHFDNSFMLWGGPSFENAQIKTLEARYPCGKKLSKILRNFFTIEKLHSDIGQSKFLLNPNFERLILEKGGTRIITKKDLTIPFKWYGTFTPLETTDAVRSLIGHAIKEKLAKEKDLDPNQKVKPYVKKLRK